ncbi:MAG TPA: hypothetical protein PLR99_08205 [Polyangiaceae bacterium]|nr:hypothetical protein [Polyangiaceae bacterium]
MKTLWVPPAFESSVLGPIRRGEKARVTVQELVEWFGFSRRGTRVNEYIREAFEAHGLTCSPALEKAFPNDTLTIVGKDLPVLVLPPPVAKPLPYPFAVSDRRIATQSEAKRVVSRLNAIELSCAYLVFAQLAALRKPDGDLPTDAQPILAPFVTADASLGPPISFGTWLELGRRLAALRPVGHGSVASACEAAFRDAELSHGLVKAVQVRNKFQHGSNVPQAAYAAAEPDLTATGDALRLAMAPVLEGELVMVAATEVGEAATYRYRLRVLHGESVSFASRHLEANARMPPGWAHLMLEGEAPLRLAPGLFGVEDQVTEQVELYVCRTLALQAKQAVKLASLTGHADRKELLPV